MKFELLETDTVWKLTLTPETKDEKCEFDNLATRPNNQIEIIVTGVGSFRKEKRK